MGCLTNISKPVIGIREDCQEITPTSGLYINDLEGITLKMADGIVSKDDKNGVDLLNKKIQLAEQKLLNEASLKLPKHILKKTLVDFDTIGVAQDDLQSIASKANYLKGIKIRIDESSYIDFQLHKVGLWLDADVTTNVEVWDLITNTQLSTIEVEAKQNEITYVQVDEIFNTQKNRFHIAILYDAGVAGTFETSIHKNICRDCHKTSGYINNYTHITGVEIDSGDSKLSENFDSINGTGGLFVDYAISCSTSQFLCANSRHFALPLLYKAGQEILREAVYSDRLNKYVIIKADLNKDLEEDFKQMYQEALDGVVQRMSVPKDDICFRCDPAVRRNIEIPR